MHKTVKSIERASNDELAYHKNRILNFLINNSGQYSLKEISNIFGYSERRIQDFIKEFNSGGFVIKSKSGKYKIIRFPGNFKIVRQYAEKEELKKYVIYSFIKDMSSNSVKLSRKYFLKVITSKEIPLTESVNYLQNMLRELKQEGYIDLDKDNIYLKESFLKYLDKNKLLKLLMYLNIMKNIYPNKGELHEVFFKVLCYYESLGGKFNKNAAVYHNKHKVSTYDEILLKTIEKAILRHKKINFFYKTLKVYLNIKTSPEGLIYNGWKDFWYVICKNKKDFIYRIDRIIDIKMLSEESEVGDFHKEFYELSIGASSENIEEVEVQFEKEEFIRKKLVRYKSIRKNAEIEEGDDKYILRDKVCGINEFERWLRGFGKSAFCVKPSKLRDKILENIKLMKDRYGI